MVAIGPVKSKGHGKSELRAEVMATDFEDAQGVLFVDFLEGQRTVTAAYHESVLRKIAKTLAEKHLEILHQIVFLHYNNAPNSFSHQTRAIL